MYYHLCISYVLLIVLRMLRLIITLFVIQAKVILEKNNILQLIIDLSLLYSFLQNFVYFLIILVHVMVNIHAGFSTLPLVHVVVSHSFIVGVEVILTGLVVYSSAFNHVVCYY